MLANTAGGILVFRTLIGLNFPGIDSKLDELRKGLFLSLWRRGTRTGLRRSISIISELTLGNDRAGHSACIVVLADNDKVEMEDEIRCKGRFKTEEHA